MQHLDEFHPFPPHPVDHPIPVARGDVVSQAGPIDAAAHAGEVRDQRCEALDL